MWVWLKLKLILKEDFCVVSARAIFVNFFIRSTRRYLNRQTNIVTFYPKIPKLDQNLQFTPLSKTTSIPVGFM